MSCASGDGNQDVWQLGRRAASSGMEGIHYFVTDRQSHAAARLYGCCVPLCHAAPRIESALGATLHRTTPPCHLTYFSYWECNNLAARSRRGFLAGLRQTVNVER